MDKYELNVSVWFEDGEWFYSVIQECEGETETLAYGSNYDPKVAIAAITDTLRTLEL